MALRLDWDDLKIVLAIGEQGTLGRAARALRLTQPTISRRLNALEAALGIQLFERTPAGLVATALCRTLLEEVAPMERHAQAVLRKLAALGHGLAGELTITSIDWLGDIVLAPLLARFGAAHPGLKLRLVNDERNFNLAARDADLSIAFRRLEQENLVQRRICTVHYGLYGVGGAQEDASALPLVMIERMDGSYVFESWRQAHLPDRPVVLGVNSMNSVLGAVLDGGVAGILPRVLANRHPQLRRLPTDGADIAMELRIGYHQDLRQTTRLRALVDYLAGALPAGLDMP